MKLTPKQAIVLSTIKEGEELTIRELAEGSQKKLAQLRLWFMGYLAKNI